MLYLFVLLMPILIVMWIPGLGPFTLVSQFVKRLAGFFFPFLFMTVPVALLFRLGELMGASSNLSMGGFGAWLVALVIPLIAVVSPFVLFWQAGALFFMADRASRHVSSERASRRAQGAKDRSQNGMQAAKNFGRGAGGKPPQKPDGQTMLGSGDSRAHAAGSRLNATATQVQSLFSQGENESTSGGEGSRQTRTPGSDRSNNFEALRRDSPKPQTSADADRPESNDERPWYIN
jgi:uncharacterized membrane protein